jgi:hypothetical protein
LKKSGAKNFFMLGLGRDVANAHGGESQSFFASFCSQKEVLAQRRLIAPRAGPHPSRNL